MKIEGTFHPDGFWIPIEVFYDGRLQTTDKFLYALIRMLDDVHKIGNRKIDGCSASNGFFSEVLNVKKRHIQKSLVNLIRADLIERRTTNSGSRLLKVTRKTMSRRKALQIINQNKKAISERPEGGVKNDTGGCQKRHPKNIEEKHKSEFLNKNTTNVVFVASPKSKRQKIQIPWKHLHPVKRKKIETPLKYYSPVGNVADPKATFDTLKLLPYKNASMAAKQILDTWNKLDIGTRSKSVTTLRAQKTLYALDNYVLKKYTLDQVLEIMHTYKTMRDTDGIKIDITRFFVPTKFAKRTIFEWIASTGGRSLNKKEEKLVIRLKKSYKRKILDNEKVKFTMMQNMSFVEAAKKINKFMETKEVEKFIPNATEGVYISLVFHALEAAGIEISPKSLSSFYTYNDIVPKYLTRNFDKKG